MLFKSKEKNDDSFWITYADLMTCLMIIFMFITFVYIINYKSIETTEKTDREIVVNSLTSKGINVDENLNVFVSSNTKNYVSFKQAKWKLKDLTKKERELLSDFIPKFIHAIYYDNKVKNLIKEVRIEGYSSSEWNKTVTEEQAYLNNMNLSQKRTMTIVNSILKNKALQKELEENKELSKWLLQHLTANGFSSSNYVKDIEGNEDKEKSRRVTFSILLKEPESILK